MNSDFKTRVLQRTLAIQGITIETSDHPKSPLPIFNVSNRRTVTDRRINIIEQGTTQDTFETVTIESDHLPEEQNIAILEFSITTDFWSGFGQMSLSDTALLVYPPEEEIQQTTWESNNNQLSPIVKFNSYTLTKNGEQQNN